ncbi:MAG TPA: TlpA disulfide reductase family protein [Chitinophagaceae bacterium]|nr:TlpA disulfide reductase family protein [Chitinophagaceae bacterium]
MRTHFAVIILILLIGCNDSLKEKSVPTSQLMREIDKIRLTDLQGHAVSINQYKGKTIFINFWATWCKPCIQEMPSIKEAQHILQKENIIFLMASDESTEQIKDFSNTHEYKFNYVRIENSEEMNVQALPTTFIYNNNGKLVFSETGSRKWNDKNNIDLILKIANANE